MPDIYENPPSLEKQVIKGDPDSLEIEKIEFSKGIRIFLKGHPYPQKSLPTKEALWAINVCKRLLRESLGLRLRMLLLGRRASLRLFCAVCWPTLSPYILKYEFLTPTAQELYDMLRPQGEQFAKIIAHIFEYDGAYRFRLMDLASESSKEALLKNPRREIRRLLELNRVRDYQEVTSKIEKVGKFVLLLLWVPVIHRSLKRALQQGNFSKLQFDRDDAYWACHKRDYNYFGETYEERQDFLTYGTTFQSHR